MVEPINFASYLHGVELIERADLPFIPKPNRKNIIGLPSISPFSSAAIGELILLASPDDVAKNFPSESEFKLVVAGIASRITELKERIKKRQEKAVVAPDTEELKTKELAALNKDLTDIEKVKTEADKRLAMVDLEIMRQSIDDIYKNDTPVIIALNMFDITKTKLEEYKDLIKGTLVARTGIYKFLESRDDFDFSPKILLAPYFSHEEDIQEAILDVAKKLKARSAVDLSDDLTVEAAIKKASVMTTSRLLPCYPKVHVKGREDIAVPMSALAAGHIAKVIRQRGVARSPSNLLIDGVSKLSKKLSFAIDDEDTDVNRLNQAGISTIVRQNGHRFWGSRTPAKGDPVEVANLFFHNRGLSDDLNEVLLDIAFEAIDQGVGRNFIEEVTENMNEELRQRKRKSQILGGVCTAPAEMNPATQLLQGIVVFATDYTHSPTAEQIKVISTVTSKYLAGVFKDAT